MIAAVSIALAAYETYAVARHKTKVTELSHRWPYGLFVWGWWVALAVHFLAETLKPTNGVGQTE